MSLPFLSATAYSPHGGEATRNLSTARACVDAPYVRFGVRRTRCETGIHDALVL
jgi:hypothetical protein